MTWIVVVGSTLVMLLWILVYSFFMSIDFVDEVLILFGGINFWATVLITAAVALGAFITIYGILSKSDHFFSTAIHCQICDDGVLPSRQGHRSRDVGHG